MHPRYEGRPRREDIFERDRNRRRRLTQGHERRPQAMLDPYGNDPHPGRAWEHERVSGSWRAGEAYDRSPREEPPPRYGYGSASDVGHRGRAFDDGEDWRTDRYAEEGLPHRDRYDDRHDAYDSPGEFGERSYAGYGDWSARDDDELRTQGAYDDVEERWSARRPRSGAARWGLGRAGAPEPRHEDWRRHPGAEEARAGRFAGRGPRGYQRSDERVREDACDLLLEAAHVDASDVSVSVSGGEITLEGTVPTRRMKRAAEDLLEDVPGVLQVHNQLRVQTNGVTGAVDSAREDIR